MYGMSAQTTIREAFSLLFVLKYLFLPTLKPTTDMKSLFNLLVLTLFLLPSQGWSCMRIQENQRSASLLPAPTVQRQWPMFTDSTQSQTIDGGRMVVREQTTFQTSGHWKPATDVRSDLVMVYGANDRPGETFRQRVQSWRDRGYTTHFMTGIAWGDYQDYLTGK